MGMLRVLHRQKAQRAFRRFTYGKGFLSASGKQILYDNYLPPSKVVEHCAATALPGSYGQAIKV
jgi:hypothetical protein